ncbi:hypothetical protein CANMA_000792 [Candida margitis]|uniref:uncharacterized protein n=1 Tax=Candida margitis TaxID=1775924 RepID=UPI002227CDEF|nr:uncharacterized protein CANMA_000792 [Candida margitis]KAI5970181.1 hypothetical protein CANMA_000792 [Candida margitis]
MENYNQLLLQQLNPLLRIHIDPTIVNTNEVATLLTQFELYNVKNKVWDNSAIRNRLTTPKYILSIDHDEADIEIPKREQLSKQHSLISPFNQNSLLFPNGILNHQWFEKYITKFPFAMIYVCELDGAAKDVELVISMKKLKLKLEEIDCKLVLLLITPQPIDEERMNMFRAELNFPKPHFLFNLSKQHHPSNTTLQSDCEVLVSKILSSLTKTSHDYYANLEYKLKQRYKKSYDVPPADGIDTSIELTPKFLEIRNLIKQAMILQFMQPSNLEPGVKLLEIAYQDLITLLDGIYAVNLSDHDNIIIGQSMTLLDIIAFHIVRGYFAIEEPIKSLRKHKTHIINVVEVLKRDHDWISVQYEWLAQLMQLIPYSIITNLNTTAVLQMKAKSKNANTLAMMYHFGGIHTPEFDLVSNPGLVLVKAYEMSSHSEKRVKLLQSAIETLETNQSNALHKSSVSGQDNLDSLLSYLTWLIGEEYFQNGDVKRASDYFEMAYSSLGSAKWGNISYFLLGKLLQCYSKLDMKKQELNTILKLSTIPKSLMHDTLIHCSTDVLELNPDSESKIIELDILDSKLHELFVIDALLINKTLSHETTVDDDVLIQVDLRTKLNLDMLKSLLPQSTEIRILVNQIDVSFTRGDGDVRGTVLPGLKNISVTNDATKERPSSNLIILNGQELNTAFVDSANLTIDSPSLSPITIQQVQKVTSSGNFQIDVVKLQITIELKHGDEVIRLNKIELHQSFPHALSRQCKIKLANGTTKPIRLGSDETSASASALAHQLVVSPPKPDFKLHLLNEVDCYIVGERLSIPLKCEFSNITIFQKADLIADVKRGDVVVTWDKLKDEEPLDLKAEANVNGGEHMLHVYARNWSGEAMSIEVSLAVVHNGETKEKVADEEREKEKVDADVADTDVGDASLVYKVFELKLPVIPEPFKYHYYISPCLDERCLLESKDEQTKEPFPPLSLRQWRGKLRLVDQYGLKFESYTKIGSSGGSAIGGASRDGDEEEEGNKQTKSLQVVDVDFDIVSGLADLSLTVMEKEGKYDQLFTTQLSSSGKLYRNAQIITSMTVKWKRSGADVANDDDVVNEFPISEWKVSIPLFDPRVFVYIEKYSADDGDGDGDDSDDDLFKFYYVIENASVHVLTFVSELTNLGQVWELDTSSTGKEAEKEAEKEEGGGDDAQSYANSKPFTMEPNTRKIIQFQLKKEKQNSRQSAKDGNAAVQLPTFKLFDVNYKVYLYVVPTQPNVKLKDGNLYLL